VGIPTSGEHEEYKKVRQYSSSKIYNFSITNKNVKMVKLMNKDHNSLIVKMINDFKEDSNKQMSEGKKSTQAWMRNSAT
jgi:hypothetical protein